MKKKGCKTIDITVLSSMTVRSSGTSSAYFRFYPNTDTDTNNFVIVTDAITDTDILASLHTPSPNAR